MRLKHYIAAGVLGLCAAAASDQAVGRLSEEKPVKILPATEESPNCAGLPISPADREYQCRESGTSVSGICFDLEHSSIDNAYDAGSDKVFAIVYEAHIDVETQANVFYTVEELINENGSKLIATEYFQGEFAFGCSNGCSIHSEYPPLNALTASYFMELGCPSNECTSQRYRRELALMDVLDERTPLGAVPMFEIIYAEAIVTFGIDDWSLIRTLEGVADEEARHELANEPRSHAFARNLRDYLENHAAAGRVVIVSVGLDHKDVFEEELRGMCFSYVSLMPDGLEEFIRKEEEKNKSP
ncbi:MAG TPA: hypothetical protein HA362_03590 [Nanoarchaeota archaeon]|nr:hypothetical protein [Nanoarchaeota archaeon]